MIRKAANSFLFLPLIWVVIFFAIPISLMLCLMFFQRSNTGDINFILSFTSFRIFVDKSFYYALFRSTNFSLATSICTFIIAYPIARTVSTVKSNTVKYCIVLTMFVPFLTNIIIRLLGWTLILGNNGVINTLLINLNIIDEPIELLYTDFSILVGMIYNYLPLMVIVLFISLEKIPKDLFYVAKNLGGSLIDIERHIYLGGIIKGITIGFSLITIMSMSDLVTPDLLGGNKNLFLSPLIQSKYIYARDWPTGAVICVFMIAYIVIYIYVQSWALKKIIR